MLPVSLRNKAVRVRVTGRNSQGGKVCESSIGAGASFACWHKAGQAKEAPAPMELSHTVRPWEFLPVTGTRAALFGNETGKMEAWVYPLKLFREFHLNFLTEGRVLRADTLARTLSVRREPATILYS